MGYSRRNVEAKSQSGIDVENQHPTLCILLGFFLSLFGVLLAAITGKGDGIKKAFTGIILRWFLVIAGCCFFGGLGKFLHDNDAAASSKVIKDKKEWHISIERSKIDDSETVILMRDADEVYGISRKKPTLVIRKQEGKADAFIDFNSYIGSRELDVTVRFDSDKSITEKWGTSTDGSSAFIPWDVNEFVSKVMASKQLVVRIEPKHKDAALFTFDIRGLKDSYPYVETVFK